MKVYFIQRLGFIILDISPEHYGSIKNKENENAVVEKKAISSWKVSQEVREIAASIFIYIPYRWSLNTVLSSQNNLQVLLAYCTKCM